MTPAAGRVQARLLESPVFSHEPERPVERAPLDLVGRWKAQFLVSLSAGALREKWPVMGTYLVRFKMRNDVLRPFESIESALEYMALLEEVIAEASGELEGTLASASSERFGNGVRLALYKISQLSTHVHKSRRLLNDLTLIRSVLVKNGMVPK